MRVGLYGMPCSGKTFILDRIDFLDVYVGSNLLKTKNLNFQHLPEKEKSQIRKEIAEEMMSHDNFIMDGHYAFGDVTAFTKEEGQMYDIYLYLYVNPETLSERMSRSEKNNKFLTFYLHKWQQKEIQELRAWCHLNNKDFYLIDTPPNYDSNNVELTLKFLKLIKSGWSCLEFARKCTNEIIKKSTSKQIKIFDGDKTITSYDCSTEFLNYHTNIFDGNFYTGWQFWKQSLDFLKIDKRIELSNISFNTNIIDNIDENSFILTSGNPTIWKKISSQLGIECFCGDMMSAETKYFIVKFLRENGYKVNAWGDSFSDYFMLLQADHGYIVKHKSGQISKSFGNVDISEMTIV